MGVISSLLLMLTLPLDTWIRLVVWMLIGLFIYFLYGKQHSVLGNRYPAGTPVDAALGD
jgi:APA family basic amino acid/polyamine antiporter